ncbi:MAG: M23 family metallopeptidase [Oligoflexia bacterium]|nr:M23 family metallopeptidase [Oligoflexia bacterium]
MSIKKISRHFKFTKRDYHDGIDIPAPSGTAIYSVERGKVVYSGRAFKGYGNMLLIEHKRGLATLYAHCKKLFVRSGDFVDKGEKIALVGRTGRASAPHLHFEVRINKQPVDPMEFLP